MAARMRISKGCAIAVVVASSAVHAGNGPCLSPGAAENTVRLQAGAAVVCDAYAKKCFSFADGKPGTSVPFAPAAAAANSDHAAEIREEGGKLSTCFAGKCAPLGKKLVAAIAKGRDKAQTDGVAFTLSGTTDLKVVAVGSQAWSVSGDKALKLKPPKDYKKEGGDKPQGGQVDIVDELLVSGWSNCAGPCGMSVVATSAGTNTGAWFPAGEAIVLDDKRFVVFPEDSTATATVFERHTGKPLGELRLGDGALQGAAAARLDGETLVALLPLESGGAYNLVRLKFPTTGAASFGATWATIPECK
jgi:hypothetical protein